MADIYFCREKKEKNYTTLDNTFIKDKRLSWKAKGIMTYLLSLPDDWKLSFEEVKNHASDGKTASRSAINELIQFGYIEFKRKRNEKGIFEQGVYKIIEHPNSNASNLDNPHEDNPRMGKPDVDNQTLLSTNNNQILNLPSTNSSEDSSLRSESSSAPHDTGERKNSGKEGGTPLANKIQDTKTECESDAQHEYQDQSNSDEVFPWETPEFMEDAGFKRASEYMADGHRPVKKKRVPLADREPVNDIERVEKAYMNALKDAEAVCPGISEKAYSGFKNIGRQRKMIKDWLKDYSAAEMETAVRLAAKDEFCVGCLNMTFSSILSEKVFVRLLNGNINPYGSRKRYEKPHENFVDGKRDYASAADDW